MRSSPPSSALVAALVVLVAVLVPLAVTLLTGRGDAEPGPPLGAALDGSDRRSLDAVPVRRGAAPPAVDPAYLDQYRTLIAAGGSVTG